MLSILQDLNYGFRAMRKTPGFAIVALITLVLGIGANTAIFSVVNAVLLRPLPYKNAGKIVLITTNPKDNTAGTAYGHYQLWKSGSGSFEDIAIYYRNISWSRVTLTIGDEPQRVQAGFTSSSFFSVLGVPPILGRVFDSREENERQRLVVLSEPLWKERFGGAPDVLGKSIQIEEMSFEIIGVMPTTFQFPSRETQFWVPITTNRTWLHQLVRDGVHNQAYYWRWNTVARLKPGITREAAQAEINEITKNSGDANLTADLGINLFPMNVELDPTVKLSLLILMGAVSFVLLIACINVANLLLARGIAREREMALRMALGARRGRIVRQLLTENLALGLLAGCCGLLLAQLGIKLLMTFGPQNIPRLEQVSVDAQVLGFTVLASIVAATVSGLLPAWKMSQGNLTEPLQADGRTMAGSLSKRRLAGFLIGLEFSLSLVLLTGAGLLVRSFMRIQEIDPGFRAESMTTMRVDLPAGKPPDQRAAFYDRALEEFRTLPEVTSVGAIKELFDEAEDLLPLGLRSVEGREPEPRNQWTPLIWTSISGDYFQAMGTPLLRGRYFTSEDRRSSPPVVIVNEGMAKRFWPGEDPIGKHFKGQDKRGKDDEWITVIGLVGDMYRQGLETPPVPQVFEYYKQSRDNINPEFVIRTVGNPQRLTASLPVVVHSMDPTAIVSNVSTMQALLNDQLAPRLFQTWLVGLFSVIALLLASIGIYGLMHYTVAQRRHEIGIRIALGAQASSILSMIVRQALLMTAIGLTAGVIGSLWINKLIVKSLYGVTPTDPFTFAGVAVLLLAVAATATLIPAWRASKVDPLVILRD